jgi:hypothetical protein
VGSLLILSEKMHDDDSGCLQWSYEGNHFEFYLSKEIFLSGVLFSTWQLYKITNKLYCMIHKNLFLWEKKTWEIC